VASTYGWTHEEILNLTVRQFFMYLEQTANLERKRFYMMLEASSFALVSEVDQRRIMAKWRPPMTQEQIDKQWEELRARRNNPRAKH